MQTAARKTAREVLFDGEQVGVIRDDVDLNAHRYFVQIGWDALSVDSFAIPNSYLLRGEITPCRTYKCKANLVEIREGEHIPISQVRDEDIRDNHGKVVYGFYYRYAHHEAERLIELENRAERKAGLIEVTALSGPLGNEVYRKVDLNKLFFPNWPQPLPDKNADVLGLLRTRLAELKATVPAGMPAHYLPVIFAVGDQLIEAAERAEFVQRDRLTYTHSCLKLTPKDEAYKRAYDSVDYEMLKRTGIPEVHAAEVQTAQALEKLSDDSDIKDLIKLQQQQLELQREQSARQDKIIEMLLAERQSVKETNATGKRKHNSDSSETERA